MLARTLPQPSPRFTVAALALLTALAWPALGHAESPMVTDDAGTMEQGGAKVELVWARDSQVRGPSLALAYAPLEHLEAELDLASSHDHSTAPTTTAHARGLALKWVPFLGVTPARASSSRPAATPSQAAAASAAPKCKHC